MTSTEVSSIFSESTKNSTPPSTNGTAIHVIPNQNKNLKCPHCNWTYKYLETLDIHLKEKHQSLLHVAASYGGQTSTKSANTTAISSNSDVEVTKNSGTTFNSKFGGVTSTGASSVLLSSSSNSAANCHFCLTKRCHPKLARGETHKCGFKPFRCDICNYSTTTKGNLTIHLQSDKHSIAVSEYQNAPSLPRVMESNHHPVANSASAANNFVALGNQFLAGLAKQMTESQTMGPIRNSIPNNHTNVSGITEEQMTAAATAINLLLGGGSSGTLPSFVGVVAPTQSTEMPVDDSFASLPEYSCAGQGGPLNDQFFSCLLCESKFSSSSLAQIDHHSNFDRTVNAQIQDSDPLILSTDSNGVYRCRLCNYKTPLKANYQLHCRSDKHLVKLQTLLHILEGSTQVLSTEVVEAMNLDLNFKVRCNTCLVVCHSVHRLQLHVASSRHQMLSLLADKISCELSNDPSNSVIIACTVCSNEWTSIRALAEHLLVQNSNSALCMDASRGKQCGCTMDHSNFVDSLRFFNVSRVDDSAKQPAAKQSLLSTQLDDNTDDVQDEVLDLSTPAKHSNKDTRAASYDTPQHPTQPTGESPPPLGATIENPGMLCDILQSELRKTTKMIGDLYGPTGLAYLSLLTQQLASGAATPAQLMTALSMTTSNATSSSDSTDIPPPPQPTLKRSQSSLPTVQTPVVPAKIAKKEAHSPPPMPPSLNPTAPSSINDLAKSLGFDENIMASLMEAMNSSNGGAVNQMMQTQQRQQQGLSQKTSQQNAIQESRSKSPNANDAGSPNSINRRRRTLITPEQYKLLHKEYRKNANPSKFAIADIASRTQLGSRVVRVWFQNTRSRERKSTGAVGVSVVNKRCPLCAVQFYNRVAMVQHMRGSHGYEAEEDDDVGDENPAAASPELEKFVPSGDFEIELQGSNDDDDNEDEEEEDRDDDDDGEYFDSRPLTIVDEPNNEHSNSQGRFQGNTASSVAMETSDDVITEEDVDANGFVGTGDSGSSNATMQSVIRQSPSLLQNLHGNNAVGVLSSTPSNEAGALPLRSVSPAIDSTPRRLRTTLTGHQISFMQALYLIHKSPHQAQCGSIAKEISLPKRVVQVWYQNARAREKKAKGIGGQGALVLGPTLETLTQAFPNDTCVVCSARVNAKSTPEINAHIYLARHLVELKRALGFKHELECATIAATNSVASKDLGGISKEVETGLPFMDLGLSTIAMEMIHKELETPNQTVLFRNFKVDENEDLPPHTVSKRELGLLCKACHRVFSSLTVLKTHMVHCSGQPRTSVTAFCRLIEEVLLCGVCQSITTFQSVAGLKQHHSVAHSESQNSSSNSIDS